MPKAQQPKKIKPFTIQNFCSGKDTTKKGKRQVTEWEEIFSNHTFDKKQVSRIKKEHLQLNN